jgi:hypothetical protein
MNAATQADEKRNLRCLRLPVLADVNTDAPVSDIKGALL